MRPAVYSAPWSASLRVMTALSCLLLLGVAISGILTSQGDPIRLAVVFGVPLLILLGALPFAVTGYRIEGGSLCISRPLWTTRVSLAGIIGAEADSEAMSGSVRTLGNGGLFSFTGRFRNRRLGSYRAWVTDPKRAVVIELPGRTIVVSPDRPLEMASILQELSESGHIASRT